MSTRRSIGTLLVALVCLALTSCGDANRPAPAVSARSDAIDRTSSPVEPTLASVGDEGAAGVADPVDIEEAARPLRLEIRAEYGYENARGELVLDVLEGEAVYLTLLILDASGRPVQRVRPVVTPGRDSRLIPLPGEAALSDDLGTFPFALMAGSMGEDRVEILAGEAAGSLILNVISQRADQYSWLGGIEDTLDWKLLLEADFQWGEEALSATFPEEVMAKSGRTVKLAGFMMPLDTARRQSHFVLTSSPPSCFFHLPGGPAGAVEVFATKPLEVSWDPVVLEGRFETLAISDIGVLYRLHEARAVDLAPRSPGP